MIYNLRIDEHLHDRRLVKEGSNTGVGNKKKMTENRILEPKTFWILPYKASATVGKDRL